MKKRQVLLAGNKAQLEPIEAALKKAGFGSSVTGSAFETLAELAKSKPSAVVVGSDLEDLKSYQLACLIKSGSKDPQLPVVVLDSKNGHSGFWTNAKLADLKISLADGKDSVDNLIAKLNLLIDETEKSGEAQAADWYPIVPSDKAADKYLNLIDDLLIERLMGQIARLLIEIVEPRNQFLEQYFRLLTNVFDCEVVGISVLSSNHPWLSLKANLPVSRKALEMLKDTAAKQLGAPKDLKVELLGDVQASGDAIGAFEILPVVADKTNIGALIFGTADKKGFDEASKLAMRHLNKMILPVMRLVLASQEIEVLYQKEMYRSSTDASTGLYNLEFLVGFLQQQLLFSYRQKAPVGLLIVDVDNLKAINDEFGYQVGDLVLSRMANKMLAMTRASDLIARYGGDEFAVVMPNADLAGARVLAEKIRLEMPTMNFVLPGQKKGPKITVSIGCAGFNMEDLNPETILRDAKHALQRAKSSGGNKVSA
ncbi:MAG: diguanylate cyclase [Candidatus Obscuribacterales bacterium]|nr:diguanylate cyclase [Candidatus Obscuribacterales bacterium]